MVLPALAIGAGIGLGKHLLFDKPAEDRARRQEAEIARWSPWTGINPQRVQQSNMLGSAMQGAMGGAMIGQAMGGAGGAAAAGGEAAGGAASGVGPAGTPMAPGWGGMSAAPSYAAATTPNAQEMLANNYGSAMYSSPWTMMMAGK